MPRGFDRFAPVDANVNPSGLDQNCYYCTVAALKNVGVHELVSLARTMQHDIANRAEILRPPSWSNAGDNLWNDYSYAHDLIGSILSTGQFCSVTFRRPNGSSHMVVAARQRGNANDQIVWADFQIPPNNRAVNKAASLIDVRISAQPVC